MLPKPDNLNSYRHDKLIRISSSYSSTVSPAAQKALLEAPARSSPLPGKRTPQFREGPTPARHRRDRHRERVAASPRVHPGPAGLLPTRLMEIRAPISFDLHRWAATRQGPAAAVGPTGLSKEYCHISGLRCLRATQPDPCGLPRKPSSGIARGFRALAAAPCDKSALGQSVRRFLTESDRKSVV